MTNLQELNNETNPQLLTKQGFKDFFNNLPKGRKLAFIFGFFILIGTLAFVLNNIISDFLSKSIIEEENSWKYRELKYVFGPFGTLFYFTNLSNFLLGIMMFLVAFKGDKEKIMRIFFISVALISVTFVVYWVLIAWDKKVWTNPLRASQSIYTHLFNPILGYVVLWYLKKTFAISYQEYMWSSFGVLIYFIFAIILFYATKNDLSRGVVIYSFLNFDTPFFTKETTHIALLIFLRILVFVLAFGIGSSFTYILKLIFKIKKDSNSLIKFLKKYLTFFDKDKNSSTNKK